MLQACSVVLQIAWVITVEVCSCEARNAACFCARSLGAEVPVRGGCRYAEAHQCDYDYKAAGRELLAKNNPLVQASKVERL